LGLLQHQWENPIVAALEEHFKKVLLKDKIKRKDFGKDHPDPTLRNEMLDYYVLKPEIASVSMNQQDQMKSQVMMLQRLTDMCYSTMNPKPDKEEISHALTNMMGLHLEVVDRMKPECKKMIPSLCFSRDGDTMIAVAMMDNYARDRLMTCLREVLCHKYTYRKNIIYGQMLPKTPWVFHCLKIEPNRSNVLRLTKSNYHGQHVLRMTQQLIATVNCTANTDDPSMVSREGLEFSSFRTNFSRTPHQALDMDLDEMAAKLHADRIGLMYLPPTMDARGFNTSIQAFNNGVLEEIADREAAAAAAGKVPPKLEQYPICFDEMWDSKHRLAIDKDKIANPLFYSVANDVFDGRDAKRQRRELAVERATDGRRYAGGGGGDGESRSDDVIAGGDGDDDMKDVDDFKEHQPDPSDDVGFIEQEYDDSGEFVDDEEYLCDRDEDDDVIEDAFQNDARFQRPNMSTGIPPAPVMDPHSGKFGLSALSIDNSAFDAAVGISTVEPAYNAFPAHPLDAPVSLGGRCHI
jgi:hypothetical protein